MKKHLLSTSAIALGVAMAAPASAQDWNMKWGGYANTHVGISDVSGTGVAAGADFDGVNVFTNSEIIFSPSVTLDNGMTFGYSVQMEALNAGGGVDGIDESYLTISSDTLGTIIVGSENSAGYKSMVAAPSVGSMAVNSRSTSAFIPVTGSGGFRQAALSSYTEVAGNNDVQRITYFTPSFNGLTLGVSYAPSNAGNASNNSPVNFNAGISDIFDIGANYSQSFNGVDVSFGARYGTGDTAAVGVSDPETWGVGGQVSVSGFSFGGAYTENDNGGAGGAGDQEGFSVGASYDIAGPWTVGLEGYFGETDNGAGAPSSDYDVYKLAASRSLGSGVSWDVYYFYQETNNGAVAGNPSIDGNVLATAINLSF
ncbi:MAG: porin [Roseovarius sp.]